MILPPGRDAPDDVQPLAGLHEPQAAGLTDEVVAGVDRLDPPLELRLLPLQLRHLGLPAVEHLTGVEVRVERLPVQEAGDDETGTYGTGMYRLVDGGRRYLPGQWPTTPVKLFDPAGTVTTYTAQNIPRDLIPKQQPLPAGAPAAQ